MQELFDTVIEDLPGIVHIFRQSANIVKDEPSENAVVKIQQKVFIKSTVLSET